VKGTVFYHASWSMIIERHQNSHNRMPRNPAGGMNSLIFLSDEEYKQQGKKYFLANMPVITLSVKPLKKSELLFPMMRAPDLKNVL
jgi:hypothetical protein